MFLSFAARPIDKKAAKTANDRCKAHGWARHDPLPICLRPTAGLPCSSARRSSGLEVWLRPALGIATAASALVGNMLGANRRERTSMSQEVSDSNSDLERIPAAFDIARRACSEWTTVWQGESRLLRVQKIRVRPREAKQYVKVCLVMNFFVWLSIAAVLSPLGQETEDGSSERASGGDPQDFENEPRFGRQHIANVYVKPGEALSLQSLTGGFWARWHRRWILFRTE